MRCFIAIPLSEEIKEKVTSIQKHFKIPGIKLVEKENLHITLKFLGEVEEVKIREVAKILKEIEFKQFELNISGIGTFPSNNFVRVVWVGIKSSEIYELKQLIDNLLEKTGFAKDTSWDPHLTIARVKFLSDKSTLLKKIEELKNIEIGKQKVDKFTLFESVLKKEGPIYNKIEEIRLCQD